MNILLRYIQRFIILVVSISVIWFIVTKIFSPLDQRLPLTVALIFTYFISAYIVLPRVVHFTSFVLKKGRIPRFSRASDGLPADPITIVFIGTKDALTKAFHDAGWYTADRLSPVSIVKMLIAFIGNKPYPTAPFSSLYVFNRKQDIGFQLPIGNSPRKRHHIRCWATSAHRIFDPLDIKYWIKKQKVDYTQPLMWVCAATKDTGIGLEKLTYQITHAVDRDVNEERDMILSSLKESGSIDSVTYFDPNSIAVGKYISDGRIAVATLC